MSEGLAELRDRIAKLERERDDAQGVAARLAQSLAITESQRDAAVADSAALLMELTNVATFSVRLPKALGDALLTLINQPHPGAVLLERLAALTTALSAIHGEAEGHDSDPTRSYTDSLDACKHIASEALEGKFSHPASAAMLEELSRLRGVEAQAQVDAKFIYEALGWAGEWPRSLPAPSRAVVELLNLITGLRHEVAHLKSAAPEALHDAIDWCRAAMRTATDSVPRLDDHAGLMNMFDSVATAAISATTLSERVKRLEEALTPISGAVRHMRAYALNKPFRLQISAELDGRAYVAEATDQEVLAIIAAVPS